MTIPVGFRVSQDYTILEPKSGPAFIIPCSDWERLKKRLGRVSTPPWFFENVAPAFAGVGLTMVVSILVGMLPSPSDHPNALVIAWSVFVVAMLCSILSFYFA